MTREPDGRSPDPGTRRRYPRVKVSMEVRVTEPSGQSWSAEAQDLSPLGIKVRDGHVAPTSIVDLEFQLPGDGPRLTIGSFAVRDEPDGVAFTFVDLTRGAFALIRQAVDLLLLGRKLWILIVEPDEALAGLLADYVEARGDIPIVIRSAEEALDYLTHDRPDAVLLDLSLPVMSGSDFLDALARRGTRLPILVVSATWEAAARSLEQGALDFLQKPLDPERVLAALAALEFRSLEDRLSDAQLDLGV